jgi:hypothetical protein
MESTYEKIIRKTGRKPISCKCEACKKQCSVAPCLGTPQDIEKIIDAGYGDKIAPTQWAAGMMMGVVDHVVLMFQIRFDEKKGGCVFFNNGLCELHDKGLKPTEGRLSHHTTTIETFNPKKSLSWNVAKEWMKPENEETIMRLIDKINNVK